jgi:NADPH:quinone reductase-like Zn-dependent oxidoreductase
MPGRRPRSVPFSARSSNEFACCRTRTFVFDPGDPQLRERVLAVIAPKKIDLVIDSIGGTLLNQLVSMLGYSGRVSVVGRSGGVVPPFNTASLLFRRVRPGGVAASECRGAEAAASHADEPSAQPIVAQI